jgi:hypothetical protein
MKSGRADTLPREKIAIPDGDSASRTSNGGGKSKVTKSSRAEIMEVCVIKRFSFSLLETNNITARLINFLPNIIPSSLRINTPQVPVKYSPISTH